MKKFLKASVLVVTLALVITGIASLAVLAQTPNGIRGAFSGDVYLPRPFKFVFGHGVSTDITLGKGTVNTLALGPAGAHFGATAANQDMMGTCVLGTSCVITFTNAYATAPVCIGTDQTAAAAVKCVSTTTTATLTGTGTDTIAYLLFGNPN